MSPENCPDINPVYLDQIVASQFGIEAAHAVCELKGELVSIFSENHSDLLYRLRFKIDSESKTLLMYDPRRELSAEELSEALSGLEERLSLNAKSEDGHLPIRLFFPEPGVLALRIDLPAQDQAAEYSAAPLEPLSYPKSEITLHPGCYFEHPISLEEFQNDLEWVRLTHGVRDFVHLANFLTEVTNIIPADSGALTIEGTVLNHFQLHCANEPLAEALTQRIPCFPREKLHYHRLPEKPLTIFARWSDILLPVHEEDLWSKHTEIGHQEQPQNLL